MMRNVILEKGNVGLMVNEKYDYLMAITPLDPKGQPRNLKRLVRIKRNVVRELRALDRELTKHRVGSS